MSSEYIDLYDYRCRVSTLYRERDQALQVGEDPASVVQRFRTERDQLFAFHPQSALDEKQRRHFQGLRYFPFHTGMRFLVEVDTDVEPKQQTIVMNAQESMTMTTIGHLSFSVDERLVTLSLYWLNIYGGGLFLPFRDTTCPLESYGGGRYLFDTIKGSNPIPTLDEQGGMLLDFNYAYNPSCAYNNRWVCPLAPLENHLPVAIRAGEMHSYLK